MKDGKETLIVYQKQVDICKRHLSPEQFGRLMFALFDPESPVDDDIALAYEFMSLQRDVDSKKYEKRCEQNRVNGKKGGRPKTEKTEKTERFSEKPNGFFENPNDNDNDNENEKGNDNVSVPDNPLSLLSFFNSKTGSSYKDTDQFEDLINQRLSEGYTFEDLRSVIEKKAAEWSCDGKMRTYLRPSTLFGEKFEEYLNAPDPIAILDEKKESRKAKELKDELKADMEGLDSVTNRIEEIRSSDSVKENYDELNELKLQQAIYEEQVENLKRRLGAS